MRFFNNFWDFRIFWQFLTILGFLGVFFNVIFGFFLIFWIFIGFFLDYFGFFGFFWIFGLFKKKKDFLGFFLFFWFLSKLQRLLVNVTRVTTRHQKSPKMGKNSIKRSFFARRAKKVLAEGRSPPQDLEVGPRSRPYLLVLVTQRTGAFSFLLSFKI